MASHPEFFGFGAMLQSSCRSCLRHWNRFWRWQLQACTPKTTDKKGDLYRYYQGTERFTRDTGVPTWPQFASQ